MLFRSKSIDSANNYIDAEIFELNMQWINKYIYTRNNEINKNFQVAYDCLREIDVRVKVIKFPERLSKKNKENIGCINKPSFQMLASAMYMTYKEIGNKRLKDLYIKADKPDEKRLGDYERTVYLVGPCIVSGHQVVFEYSLAYRLYQLFISNGFEYNVECVIITNHIMKDRKSVV